MKLKFLLLGILIFTAVNSVVNAQDKDFGVGIMLGEPTGLSAKYWTGKETAIDFGLAYSLFGGNRGISFHIDFVNHIFNSINFKDEDTPVYYGFGARFRSYENAEIGIGARGVLGVLWFVKDYPIDVFLEASPVFDLLPQTDITFDAALGARYYFGKGIF